MTSKTSVPIVFWIISILALLWNLMGVRAFGVDIMMTEEMLDAAEKLNPGTKEQYVNNPMWMKVIYGIATLSGLAASILLLVRKKIANPLFMISFVAVFVQMGYSMFVAGNGISLMPVLVIAIAAFLIYYSRKSIALGWIN